LTWIDLIKESFLWVLKIGFFGIVVKLAIDQYARVIKQRDIALSKNLDLRFDGVKTHIDNGLKILKNNIDEVKKRMCTLEKRVNALTPSMDISAKAIGNEVQRYERIINGLKAALKKSDHKFSAHKQEILEMRGTLAKMAEAIVSLNNKIAEGKTVKSVDSEAIVSKIKKG